MDEVRSSVIEALRLDSNEKAVELLTLFLLGVECKSREELEALISGFSDLLEQGPLDYRQDCAEEVGKVLNYRFPKVVSTASKARKLDAEPDIGQQAWLKPKPKPRVDKDAKPLPEAEN